jgi:hypothetical protein
MERKACMEDKPERTRTMRCASLSDAHFVRIRDPHDHDKSRSTCAFFDYCYDDTAFVFI